eukprot:1194382-Prymnesium_polylepis.1
MELSRRHLVLGTLTSDLVADPEQRAQIGVAHADRVRVLQEQVAGLAPMELGAVRRPQRRR